MTDADLQVGAVASSTETNGCQQKDGNLKPKDGDPFYLQIEIPMMKKKAVIDFPFRIVMTVKEWIISIMIPMDQTKTNLSPRKWKIQMIYI